LLHLRHLGPAFLQLRRQRGDFRHDLARTLSLWQKPDAGARLNLHVFDAIFAEEELPFAERYAVAEPA
jgi:hypothetical protein